MEELLRQKGYSGPIELGSILQWLELKKLYIDFSIVWDNEGINKVGIQAHLWIEPYDAPLNSLKMLSYMDAVEFIICYYKDYL